VRFKAMIRSGLGWSCSLWLIGCSVGTPNVPLHDSTLPIPHIYDATGRELMGYQGYSDGFVATTLKACEAFLDAEDAAR
jgi:hypothetical protein